MTPTTMRGRMTKALAATTAGVALLGAGSARAASPSAVPDPAAVVDAFVAWGATSGTQLGHPACALPSSDQPQVAVCYGTAGGTVVMAAVVLGPDGTPGTIRSIPPDLGEGAVAGTAPAASGDVSTTFGPGTVEVGVDIDDGVYAARVPDGETCYWERVSGFDGELSDSIANGSAETGQLVVVVIEPTDAGFTSDGCGTWNLLA
jgi:hypothetical protein